MNHDIISYTPIVYDDGSTINAYIHKLPSGWYAMHAEYPFRAYSDAARTRHVVRIVTGKQIGRAHV